MEEIQNTPGELQEAAAPESLSQNSQENQVPVHVVQSLRSENQQLKENFKMLNEHLELLKANQPQKASNSEDSFSSLSDHDVLTVGDAKKVLSQMENKRNRELEELKIAQTYPDYADTIRKYLPQVLKEDPDLRLEIENAKNPFKMAYMLAKKSDAYLDEKRSGKKSEDATRILANTQKSGNLSAVGSVSPISQASHYKAMSEDDFRKVMNKNMGSF